jgi:flagellar basal-body rod protein FlgB
MQIETMMSDQIARYLDLATDETKLTATNMANIDTPGFRAMGFDFEAEMRQAMSGIEEGGDNGFGPSRPKLRAEENLITRPDGNNVSMDRESLHMAEAQLKYRTGITLIKQEYQTEMDAIHADSK